MNQDAIRDAYTLFVKNGYKGDINQFYDLLNENEDAVNDAHGIFAKNGYKGDVNQFSDLLGVRQPKPSAWQNIKNNLSNAFDTLSAAHNSTSTPDELLICESKNFSRSSSSALIRSAFCKSTRTPF